MKKYTLGVMILAAFVALVAAVPAFAETNTPKGIMQRFEGQDGVVKPFIVGTVSAINGNTVTVLGRTGFGKTITATTTYTVDATNAKITKNNVAGTVASVTVRDIVAVQGTITGTNVVATTIRDGVAGGPGMGFGRGGSEKDKTGTPTNPIVGNGQPVIAGTISTINGSTISITNKSNVVYTIDATNAKILQGKNTITVSALKTGDAVVVQGTINGTSVVASSIIDQAKPEKPAKNEIRPGFFGGIGQFFMHLFGF